MTLDYAKHKSVLLQILKDVYSDYGLDFRGFGFG